LSALFSHCSGKSLKDSLPDILPSEFELVTSTTVNSLIADGRGDMVRFANLRQLIAITAYPGLTRKIEDIANLTANDSNRMDSTFLHFVLRSGIKDSKVFQANISSAIDRFYGINLSLDYNMLLFNEKLDMDFSDVISKSFHEFLKILAALTSPEVRHKEFSLSTAKKFCMKELS
jgi:hypothetical protein